LGYSFPRKRRNRAGQRFRGGGLSAPTDTPGMGEKRNGCYWREGLLHHAHIHPVWLSRALLQAEKQPDLFSSPRKLLSKVSALSPVPLASLVSAPR